MKKILAILLSFFTTLFPFAGANNNNTDKPEAIVTKDEAKSIVLEHAELNADNISKYKIELDKEGRKLVYEIEFDSGKYEYDYEVNAETGKIIKAEKEIRD